MNNNRLDHHKRPARSRLRLAAVVAAGALVFASCASDDGDAAADADQTTTTQASTTTEAMVDDGAMGDMMGAFGPACGAVPADGEGSFAGMADDTAATAASNNPLLSTLVDAVVAADLVDTLNSDGPFTIFAPTNDAFAAIDPEILDAVLADKDLLTAVLTYHVVPGDNDAAALSGGTFATVEGGEVSLGADGTTVNDSHVICSDVPVANGTVHIIDSVLLPQVALDAIAAMTDDSMGGDSMGGDSMGESAMMPSGPACGAVPADGEGSFAGMADDTAATAASNNPLLSTLVDAVVAADLVDTLNSDGPFTIFAPVNDAFAALPEDQLAAVLADQDLLTSVLTLHVLAGERLSSAELIEAGSAQTVNGETITFTADGDSVLVNGTATTLCMDVQTANATVHIIDSVLLPSS
ncbi:MAG: fasciclin domain-containing protein [Acidimicrobiales bacterium]|nr:fasciclin domain-containing protein [Acidimicrobiales bacterium]